MESYDKKEYWFESAEYDLQTAKAMLETGRFLYVGFMCHQTIEKSLKGIFVSLFPNEELPYIHKLIKLSNLCKIREDLTDEQLTLLDTLNPLNVEARYPTQKSLLFQSLTFERCEELIQRTEALFEWLKTKQ